MDACTNMPSGYGGPVAPEGTNVSVDMDDIRARNYEAYKDGFLPKPADYDESDYELADDPLSVTD